MAKGKKKHSKNGPNRGGSQYGSSDDESVDTSSVFSGDLQYRGSQENTDEDGSQSGLDELDTFEDKLKEILDAITTNKAAQKRTQSLQMLCKALAGRYCPEFLSSRPATMTDLVEKSLKKGKGEEQSVAANLAAILVLQYGASPEGSEVYQTLSKLMTTLVLDNAVSAQVRERIVTALAVTAYMAEDDPLQKLEVMETLRKAFSGSFLKGDGVTPNIASPTSLFHQSALLNWALLLTVISPEIAFQNIDKNLTAIAGLLECTDVDMRVAAGEAIATMYELARERDLEFEGDDIEGLCDSLHKLATDSQKFRAKKDRKLQKSSFRDIERAVRDREGPDFNVQFGVEVLKIRTWEDKRTYDALCGVLGSGMNHHLQNNPEVRALFGLGAPLIVDATVTQKTSKLGRHLENMYADRRRTLRLAKVRDKRVDVM